MSDHDPSVMGLTFIFLDRFEETRLPDRHDAPPYTFVMKKKKKSPPASRRKASVGYRLYDGSRLVCKDSWAEIHRMFAKLIEEGKTPRLAFEAPGVWIVICR